MLKCKGGNEITGEVHAQDVEVVEECEDEEKEYDLEEIEKMVMKLYCFKRHASKTVHETCHLISCLLDPLGQDSVALGVDSIAVASPACSAVSCIAIGDARAAVGSLEGAAPSALGSKARRIFSTLAPVSGSLSVDHCSTIGNSVSSGIGNSFCNNSVHDIIDNPDMHVIWENAPSVSEDSEVLPRDPLIPEAGSNFCSSGASHQLQSNYLIDLQTASMYSEFENIVNEDESDEDESASSHLTNGTQSAGDLRNRGKLHPYETCTGITQTDFLQNLKET